MNTVQGDLLKLAEAGEFDVIVHGCNCFNTMGSGIAAQIRKQYPKAYDVDQATSKGDLNKLGTFTQASTNKFVIINAYTQFGFNTPGLKDDVFEYTAFALILEKLGRLWPGRRFGFPLIGCGLAGGDKARIMLLLNDFSEFVSHVGGTVTVVEFI